jgi:hypothetical protein
MRDSTDTLPALFLQVSASLRTIHSVQRHDDIDKETVRYCINNSNVFLPNHPLTLIQAEVTSHAFLSLGRGHLVYKHSCDRDDRNNDSSPGGAPKEVPDVVLLGLPG